MKLKSRVLSLALFLFASLIPLLAIFTKSIFFQNNDDIFIMGRASGMFYGEPSSELIYLSPPLSNLLKILYVWTGEWSWYTLALIFTQLISVFIYLWLFNNKILILDKIWNKLLLLLIITTPIFLFYILFFSLQFTQTAIMAAGVGTLAFLFGDSKSKQYFGLGLIALGFFWRFDAPAVVIAFVLGAFFLFELVTEKKLEVVNFVKRVSPIALIAILGFGSYTLSFNNWAPWVNDEKKEYVELKNVFTQLYGFESTATSYQDLKKPAKKVSWSDNDWELYQAYYFADSEVFSIEKQSAIARERIQTSYSVFALLTLKNLIYILQDYYQYLLATFLLSMIAITFLPNKRSLNLLILWSFIFVTYFFILLIGERLPDRVFWPFTFVVAITWLSLGILKNDFQSFFTFTRLNKTIASSSLVILLAVGIQIHKENQEKISQEKWWRYAAEQQILNIDKIYNFESDKPIMTFFSFYENFRKTIDSLKGPDHLPEIWNQLIMIGWENRTPEFNERLARNGLTEDIFTSIALGDAYLATWNNLENNYEVRNTSIFLREHKNIEINWEPSPFVFSDAGFAIWRAEGFELIN